MGFVLKEKLKGLKAKIKEWNKEVYGGLDTKIQLLVEEIKEIDVRGELCGLSNVEAENRKNFFSHLWHLLKSKDSMLFQRSRMRWIKEGDANTSYFHNCVKQRRSCNSIRAILVEDVWLESPLLIRQATTQFFRNHFQSIWWHRPTLEGVEFPCLAEVESDRLMLPFSLEEIKVVVKDC
jgi:hypothetical protein